MRRMNYDRLGVKHTGTGTASQNLDNKNSTVKSLIDASLSLSRLLSDGVDLEQLAHKFSLKITKTNITNRKYLTSTIE